MSETPERSKLQELLNWPVVALFFIGCATIFSLVFWGHQKLDDISGFISAVALIIVGVLLRQVSRDTNGNLTKRDAEIATLRRELMDLHAIRASEAAQMAQQVPPSASLPPTLAADPHALVSDAFNSPTVQVPTVQRT